MSLRALLAATLLPAALAASDGKHYDLNVQNFWVRDFPCLRVENEIYADSFALFAQRPL